MGFFDYDPFDLNRDGKLDPVEEILKYETITDMYEDEESKEEDDIFEDDLLDDDLLDDDFFDDDDF